MMTPNTSRKKSSQSSNWRSYLSYGIQLMATIAVGLFLGYKADQLLNTSFPLLFWLLPTLLLVYMLIKLVKQFSKKRSNKAPENKTNT